MNKVQLSSLYDVSGFRFGTCCQNPVRVVPQVLHWPHHHSPTTLFSSIILSVTLALASNQSFGTIRAPLSRTVCQIDWSNSWKFQCAESSIAVSCINHRICRRKNFVIVGQGMRPSNFNLASYICWKPRLASVGEQPVNMSLAQLHERVQMSWLDWCFGFCRLHRVCCLQKQRTRRSLMETLGTLTNQWFRSHVAREMLWNTPYGQIKFSARWFV